MTASTPSVAVLPDDAVSHARTPFSRRKLTDAAYRMLRRSGAARMHSRLGGVVFCYHNVVPDDFAGRVGDTWLHIGESQFRQQVEWISHRLTVVTLAEMLSRLSAGRSVRGLAALTFDDGYAGAVRHAVPVLRRASLPFTLFPVVRAVDAPRPFWWDRLGGLATTEREGLLSSLQGDPERIAAEWPVVSAALPDVILPASWTILRQMLGDDCTVGVHTVTHRSLTELSSDEIAWELRHARERIGEELGRTSSVVAYPYGRTDGRVIDETRRAGFHAAVGLDYAQIRRGAPTMNLARVNVPVGLALDTFACWASGLRLRS